MSGYKLSLKGSGCSLQNGVKCHGGEDRPHKYVNSGTDVLVAGGYRLFLLAVVVSNTEINFAALWCRLTLSRGY